MNYILLDAGVWGSVTDWLMVIITIITATYLYKTLKSQQEVQRIQTKMFEIEHLKFKESIKPILKFSKSQIKFNPTDESKQILTLEITNETNNVALNISFNLEKNKSQIFIPLDFSSTLKKLVRGDKPMLIHFLIDAKEKYTQDIVFELTYLDIAGIKYQQRVYCICDSHGVEINQFMPKIVTENAITSDMN